MRHPKIRGVRRRCTTFDRRMRELTQSFPAPHDELGYWHLHLPIAQRFINSPRTPEGVRHQCAQLLLGAASRLRSVRAPSTTARVVAAVTTPDVSDSQLIVFFSLGYFESFFDRQGSEQHWRPLSDSRSLAREWSLSIPIGFSERGFHEHIQDEDYEHHGEIWFFGELS